MSRTALVTNPYSAYGRSRPLSSIIEERIQRDPNSGCWLWSGTLDAPTGYGRLFRAGKNLLAHRVVFEHYTGPIPAGRVLDHKCRTRVCVNPHHLRPVTPAQNVLENSLGQAARNRVKTHCRRGHPLAGDNLIVKSTKEGLKRNCRECQRAAVRACRARKVGS